MQPGSPALEGVILCEAGGLRVLVVSRASPDHECQPLPEGRLAAAKAALGLRVAKLEEEILRNSTTNSRVTALDRHRPGVASVSPQ